VVHIANTGRGGTKEEKNNMLNFSLINVQ